VIDVGLFHSLSADRQRRYAAALHHACRPEAVVNILCFAHQVPVVTLRAVLARGWKLDEPQPTSVQPKVPDPTSGIEWFGVEAHTDGNIAIPAHLATARRV
jgi:hypothetical protein